MLMEYNDNAVIVDQSDVVHVVTETSRNNSFKRITHANNIPNVMSAHTRANGTHRPHNFMANDTRVVGGSPSRVKRVDVFMSGCEECK